MMDFFPQGKEFRTQKYRFKVGGEKIKRDWRGKFIHT